MSKRLWTCRRAGLQSYEERYATEDAVRVGRLHVETDGWEEARFGDEVSGVSDAGVRMVRP